MIVITMAGLSSRFFKAGYTVPKYQLTLGSNTVFYHAIYSFKNYFDKEKFVFIVRDVYDTVEFVQKEIVKLKIKDFDIVVLEHETRGQAETAYLGLKHYQDDFPITIFNIDTIRHNYIKPDFLNDCDGYLEVFKGDGEHWSFVLAGEDNNVVKTAEKERISDLCSDGLYYFKSKDLFQNLFLSTLSSNKLTNEEYYVAPMYNLLIEKGFNIKYDLISVDEVDFCGTPEEYEALSKKLSLK